MVDDYGRSHPAPIIRAACANSTVAGSALQARAAHMLANELARCERGMTPDQWREHRAWIEENARISLLTALCERAARGAL
ncbi:hypothetical protein [Burkholderia vietnamiensis]|uniref:hypothetical protein n=1 Tax=Burkholderia vietnamiensis TaxID=60552 RepID=UPI000D95443A|nr:hypothetical protein [Burkholderia vietnamiensis]MCA8183948.1 hypothetical protein [Burkholderia vietnamiensis]GBH27937.1 hypothetical protein BvRS1_49860 [Burkholderia vietnamiensis]HDR9009661.1 hypothetical protein [Burkholderia vietnamiensis]HDR9015640.1 hypothetical protein [Burkholderia vietnamiensis]